MLRMVHGTSLIAIAIGLWFIFAPFVLHYTPGSYAYFNDIFIGVLLVGAGVWRGLGLRGARIAGWSMVALGAAQFISPWLYTRGSAGGDWSAWFCGLFTIAIGLVEAQRYPGDRKPHNFYLISGAFPSEPPEAAIWRRPRLRRRRRRPQAPPNSDQDQHRQG